MSFKTRSGQGLGEYINRLLICRNVFKLDLPLKDAFPNKVMVNFNMFGACMKNGATCKLDGPFIVAV